MKYCIHCGAELEDEDRFCVHCGLAQTPASGPTCQQEPADQAPASSAQAAVSAPAVANRKPVNKAVVVLSVVLGVALAVIVCLVLVMRPASNETEAPSSNVASQQTDDSDSNASSHDSAGSDSSAAHKKESSSTQTEVSVRALSDFSGNMGACLLSSYSASSVLPASEYGTYVASNLSDGDWSTAWVEGSSGSGAGQSVTMSRASGSKASVSCLELVAGYGKSTDIYYKNARPKQVSLIADSGEVVAQVTLADSYRVVQSISFPAVSTSSITLRIDSVYEGNKYDDCAISEMRCF
mgnify:CR=1 FL=1